MNRTETDDESVKRERMRLKALREYRIINTQAEAAFDDLATLASAICETPIALVSFIEEDHQWFKAKVGTAIESMPLTTSICKHAIRGHELFTVEDATKDERFRDYPTVRDAPHVRFYAGAPLITPAGEALGTICVIDQRPRKLTERQAAALSALARQVVGQLELRRAAATNARLFIRAEREAKRRARQQQIALKLAGEKAGLRDAVAGMEQVLGIVGHELRTPLASVRAISEFLTTDGAKYTAEADQFLNSISEEVDRMSDTVNNLLEAARINSGRARWNWGTVDLHNACDEAIGSVRALLDPARVTLTLDVDPKCATMLGDGDAMRRLVMNLLSNARKHTSDGQIHVRVCDGGTDDDVGRWTEIAVTDTGGGIAPEILSRLGEAFALNSGVVGGNYVSGTGLGLAICKGIAAAHGGELRVESRLGAGTTIRARVRADLPGSAAGDTLHLPEETR